MRQLVIAAITTAVVLVVGFTAQACDSPNVTSVTDSPGFSYSRQLFSYGQWERIETDEVVCYTETSRQTAPACKWKAQ